MKLRERQLRVDRDMEENQDPLDLLSIGNMAQISDDDEDPLYEWVKSADLDDAEGGPAPQVAEGAAALGIDVDQVVEEQKADTDSFDPLVRSSARSNQGEEASSRPPPHHQVVVSDDDDETQPPLDTGPGDDDDDDDGDEGGDRGTDTSIGGTSRGGGGSGGGYTTAQSQRSVGQFTEEQSFDHATQDGDHGSRPPSRARASEPRYMFERRSKKKAGRAAADALTRSLSSMDISSDQGSSTSVPPYAYGGYHGYDHDSCDIQSCSSTHGYRQPEDSSSSHDPLTGGYSGNPYD
ncbi:serine/threonine-protein kinase 1-like [Magnolia sinica]|uniref:serine/threonine-protein kinase 1-like n=1 Tax=Magnolia sinica TaxID=86752 RepID=UPI0026596612|nr:serine/threonine-protein kinase 1-like [Magnolia sinica]